MPVQRDGRTDRQGGRPVKVRLQILKPYNSTHAPCWLDEQPLGERPALSAARSGRRGQWGARRLVAAGVGNGPSVVYQDPDNLIEQGAAVVVVHFGEVAE